MIFYQEERDYFNTRYAKTGGFLSMHIAFYTITSPRASIIHHECDINNYDFSRFAIHINTINYFDRCININNIVTYYNYLLS